MNKKKTFDCVEFQRIVRQKNYESANGDYDLMLSNMKKRIKENELYKYFTERKEKQLETI